ncbi:protease inhibitor EpiC2B [Phytophthora megakarya]|uniref:Protease inhibitor EpiC2B n=1 Tax=Phytophthora megakarya TaxID=4795 RepID=A0A225UJN5_9STRA|nr:protease inhibitor EpiC2B [Phytophthora megakarya]
MVNFGIFLFSLTLLALSTTHAATKDWVQVDVTDADSALLDTALRNTITYSPNVTTLVCAMDILNVMTQVISPSVSNYNFYVVGVVLESAEYVGVCPVLTQINGILKQ